MQTTTKAKRAGRKVSTATRSRIEAAQAIRGYVARHEEVIRYLEDVRLVQALHRVRLQHRPRSGAAVQCAFDTRDGDEVNVMVRVGDGTPEGRVVLQADFIEPTPMNRPGGSIRVCRVQRFDDGDWVDSILAEAAACYAADTGRLTLRSDQNRAKPHPAA